ncbi:hypothetical protein ISCGN_012311 [Ixodes scapularis]
MCACLSPIECAHLSEHQCTAEKQHSQKQAPQEVFRDTLRNVKIDGNLILPEDGASEAELSPENYGKIRAVMLDKVNRVFTVWSEAAFKNITVPPPSKDNANIVLQPLRDVYEKAFKPFCNLTMRNYNSWWVAMYFCIGLICVLTVMSHYASRYFLRMINYTHYGSEVESSSEHKEGTKSSTVTSEGNKPDASAATGDQTSNTAAGVKVALRPSMQHGTKSPEEVTTPPPAAPGSDRPYQRAARSGSRRRSRRPASSCSTVGGRARRLGGGRCSSASDLPRRVGRRLRFVYVRRLDDDDVSAFLERINRTPERDTEARWCGGRYKSKRLDGLLRTSCASVRHTSAPPCPAPASGLSVRETRSRRRHRGGGRKRTEDDVRRGAEGPMRYYSVLLRDVSPSLRRWNTKKPVCGSVVGCRIARRAGTAGRCLALPAAAFTPNTSGA